MFRPKPLLGLGWKPPEHPKDVKRGTFGLRTRSVMLDHLLKAGVASGKIMVSDWFGENADLLGTSDNPNALVGTKGTPANTGTAQSITVLTMSLEVGNATVKCALYKVAGLSFVAETEERNDISPVGRAWYTFNFIAPPPVVTGTAYYIVFWSPDGHQWRFTAGVAGDGYERIEAYGAWPDPLNVGGVTANRVSIYCTYLY